MTTSIHEMEEYKRLSKIKFSQLSFYVFQKNYDELKRLFDFFCFTSDGFQLTDVANRHNLDKFQDELIRATHNFVASVGSLVDHTRMFYQKNYEGAGTFPEYQKKIDEIFLSDELVSFVKDYRNYCPHYSSPNLCTGVEFVKDKGTWQYIRVDSSELLSGSFGWKSASKKFLEKFTDPFDLPPILDTYFTKIVSFYQWYYERLSEIHKVDQEKVGHAQKQARTEMAPQIMMILKMQIEDNSLPVSLDSLLAGFLPREVLSRLESTRGSFEWTQGALDFLVESDIVSLEFAQDILSRKKPDASK